MEKKQIDMIEQELMEAFLLEKTDAEIGMPDVEAELQRVRQRTGKKVSKRWAIPVAASLLVAICVGVTIYAHSQPEGDRCVAYVGGKRISDEAEVLRMMAEEMGHVSNDAEIVEKQLTDIFN